MSFTFVLSFPIFSFFTAKGRVKITNARVNKTKINNCHLNGNPVFAMKINGRLAIAGQIVVSDIVNASITTKMMSNVSHIHGRNDKIKFVMDILYYEILKIRIFLFIFFVKSEIQGLNKFKP